MTEARHTPGRLRVVEGADGNSLWLLGEPGTAGTETYPRDELVVADIDLTGDEHADAQYEADAHRLAACWNACHDAGISTKALEDGALTDLLAACEAHSAVTDHWNECSANDGECCEDGYCEEGERLSVRAWELTSTALAKAKGVNDRD